MQFVAKFFLWIIGVAIPVVIAACYGMPYRYGKTGRVVDAETQAGINGLKVSCLKGGAEIGMDYSSPTGYFDIGYDQPCEFVQVTDEDGELNGGIYLEQTVPYCEGCPEQLVIPMSKQ